MLATAMLVTVPFKALDDNLLDIHGELRRRSCAACGR